MENTELSLLNNLQEYADKKELLQALLHQLDKDTGLDYTPHFDHIDDADFIAKLRADLTQHLKKVSQNHTCFMHMVYRVDISQPKLHKLEMDEFYYNNLAEMVLNRLFQKIITKRFLKN